MTQERFRLGVLGLLIVLAVILYLRLPGPYRFHPDLYFSVMDTRTGTVYVFPKQTVKRIDPISGRYEETVLEGAEAPVAGP